MNKYKRLRSINYGVFILCVAGIVALSGMGDEFISRYKFIAVLLGIILVVSFVLPAVLRYIEKKNKSG